MTVTWHPTADGAYTVHRNHQPTTARIINTWGGFQAGTGTGDQWAPYGSPWTRATSVVAWLESGQGGEWLDSLSKEPE